MRRLLKLLRQAWFSIRKSPFFPNMVLVRGDEITIGNDVFYCLSTTRLGTATEAIESENFKQVYVRVDYDDSNLMVVYTLRNGVKISVPHVKTSHLDFLNVHPIGKDDEWGTLQFLSGLVVQSRL